MAVGVAARPAFPRRRSGPAAFVRLGPIGGNLSFACHWSGRRFLAWCMYVLRNILSLDHPIRELAQLSPPAIAIFADAAKRLVAARLQRGQHAVEQFES